MTESDLTQDLMRFAHAEMHGSVVMKHADRFNSGHPDFSLTWHGITSWWEVKHYDNEPFETPQLQKITCQRLARQTVCNYIIYEQRGEFKQVLIVHPEKIETWQETPLFQLGFNHSWVSRYIRAQHPSVNVWRSRLKT